MNFISKLSFIALLYFASSCNQLDNQPNILFIMSDDHAAHAISAYGSLVNKTPNIDRLATEGMRFDQMMVSNSICAPSRATLLTGKFNHQNGFLQNGYSFDGSQQTFPKLLQEAGYETAIIGKWHLKSEPTGFDHYNVMPGHGRFYDCWFKEKGKTWRDGVAGGEVIEGYLTDVITDLSIDWLKNRKSDKPFCLMVHHKAPHSPHHPDSTHANMYEDVVLPEPATLYDDWATRSEAENMTEFSKIADCNYPEYKDLVESIPDLGERTRIMYQEYMKGYIRLVASLDENIGRLLNHVDQAGLKEKTIVIYTSDNGFFLGDHGFYNKMWMYEEALHIPMIVRYPKEIKAGSSNDLMVQNIDFAPTFLDYAGANIPPDIQGLSFRTILNGKNPKDWRDKIYYHYYEGYEIPEQFGIRTKTDKLVCFPNSGDQPYWELFDLENDPQELNNIYNQASTGVQKDLMEDLNTLRKQYGDTLDLSGSNTRFIQIENTAKGQALKLKYPNSPKYPGGSDHPLTDGIINHVSPRWAFDYSKWVGFEVNDLDALLDFGESVMLNKVSVRFLDKLDSWIFPPETVQISVSSDGKKFIDLPVKLDKERAEGGVAFIHHFNAETNNLSVRFIRVYAKNVAICPGWHPGDGGKAWMFVDEIIIE
ncbi:MAG: sulfatase [Bacteroidetes bacterium]|jgi:arylsulfatase A-like enzyme|nr:sulfatase [Bacteroidota bacterium]MBT3749420.1 sulfatase [Bacteroidota bacterium]MBT4411081.1 sulfatase [Bacteroidota bacterium]MBT7463940.1 sulfatase [Bacteroidota bacterium]